MGQTPDRMCGGKIPHATKAAALRHRKALVINKGGFGARIKVYRCPFCNFFHVGNSRLPPKRP